MDQGNTNTASDTPRGFTPEQCQQIRDGLAEQFPHLTVTVEMRDGVLCIEALPADD